MRKILTCLLILLILYSFIGYEKQYQFATYEEKEAFIRSQVINEANVSDDLIDVAVLEVLKLPENLWIKFFKDGGKIRITYHMPESASGIVAGSFMIRNRTYCEVLLRPEYIEYSLLHEFGHYLYEIENIKNDKHYAACRIEMGYAFSAVLSDNNYFCTEEEYFAEMTKFYLEDKLQKEDAPIFYAYLEDILRKYK